MRLRMKTAAEVRLAMQKVANMVLDGEVEPRVANCVIYAGNAILQALRTDEQQKKIDELEAMIEQLEESEK